MREDLNKKIKTLVESNPGQMTENEYGKITEVLLEASPCKLLVFGCGQDSALWHEINKHGLTVFLEHNEPWVKYLQNTITLFVAYKTSLTRRWDYLPIDNFPAWIDSIDWNIVIVDAPEGHIIEAPGRLSSIKKASELCKNGIIFVHDMHREAEQAFAAKFLGRPTEVYEHLGIWQRKQ